MNGKERFGWGAFGGATVPFLGLVNLFGLLSLFRHPTDEAIHSFQQRIDLLSKQPEFWFVYGGLAVGLIVFGGFFSRMWKDDLPLKCFYIGGSASAIAAAFISAHG